MNEVSEPIVRWLEKKRSADRTSAAVLSILALGSGTVVFLVTALVIYAVISIPFGSWFHSTSLVVLGALALTVGAFALSMRALRNEPLLALDPMGYWIIKDILSVGPRLLLGGLRQVRCCALLGELNVVACARALDYLASHDTVVTWEEIVEHCAPMPAAVLKEQLCLLDGVLFIGEHASRVTLMDPFRLRLRWMRGPYQTRPPEPKEAPTACPKPVSDPETLSPYEILGIKASASPTEIKTAYRKRMKQCHPDLFAGMDQQAKALAERWTRALNAAYATLNPRSNSATSRPPAFR